MKRKGSNQYQTKWGLRSDTWASIWFIAFITVLAINVIKPRIVSPCPESGCNVNVVYAKDSKTELEEITEYIVKKFEPDGRTVAVRALACFISESGLRPEAYNFNTNKTGDYNIPQINSVHVKRFGTGFMYDWKKAIDVAYQIYKERGFFAWYGRGCN